MSHLGKAQPHADDRAPGPCAPANGWPAAPSPARAGEGWGEARRRARATSRCRWWRATVLLLLLLALAPAAAFSAETSTAAPDVAALPGYVDPDRLDLYDREENVKIEVNFQGPLIQFVAEAARGTEPELAEALAGIRSVVFRLYQVGPKEAETARRSSATAAAALARQGWQQVVKLRDEGTEAYVFLKTDANRMVGLTSLFFDDEDQFGFINVAGEIDPAQLGRIGRRFDIEMLEEAQEELSKRKATGEDGAAGDRDDTPRPPAEAPPQPPPSPSLPAGDDLP
jgi:hypothetical protein